MGNKLNIVSERGETIQVDPYLLFQRLTVIATHGKADMEPIFEYELCPYPASLAQSPMVPHFADKPKLFKNLEKYSLKTFPGMEYDVKYVLDGGDLLYKMGDWKKQKTYQEIADQCLKYVIKHYGNECVVVFDGYPERPTTKDPTHKERVKDIGVGPDFLVTPNEKMNVKKNVFLSNNRNKSNIIKLTGATLEGSGITVKYAEEDADLLTAKTAIDQSRCQKTVVTGEDTDILV